MSYIIEKNDALIRTKLTAKGREKLAKGELNYKFYSLGDSEVDYRFIEQIPSGETASKVLKPKDFQPFHKTYLEKGDCEILHPISLAEKKVVECCIENDAISRGFFDVNNVSANLLTGETYVKHIGEVDSSDLNGSKNLNLGTTNFENGDYLLLKIPNNITGTLNKTETQTPVLYLWYKITKNALSTVVGVDRNLPYFTHLTNTKVNFYIFPKSDSILGYYGSGTTVPYWNSETLEFTSDCDISNFDTPVLNQNNVWNESHLGTQSENESFLDYGSVEYISQKEYLGYNRDCIELVEQSNDCEDKLLSVEDDFFRGIGVIHFSNLNISNEYGEKLSVEKTPLRLTIPTVMYHRRWFGGSEVGDALGMSFISSGDTKTVENSQIEYVDLVEDPNLINPTGVAKVVGRVYPNLKVVTIHDQEILATMSYKANRNFTLPQLKGSMVFPINGLGTGVLPKGKTMYMTYALEANNGVRYSLPQQTYIKFVNNTKIDRDVNFTLADNGLLPFMRQIEKGGYDGLGFYAHKLKILVQIVDNQEDRPQTDNWTAIDYTSKKITSLANATIDPLKLESQNPTEVDFILTKSKLSSGVNYDLGVLSTPEEGCDDELQFGDEDFFFGQLSTKIGACVYKSVFNLNLQSSQFNGSTNKTWDNEQELYFTEVGIYSEDQQLVAISKISRPIKMRENSKFSLEVSLDF